MHTTSHACFHRHPAAQWHAHACHCDHAHMTAISTPLCAHMLPRQCPHPRQHVALAHTPPHMHGMPSSHGCTHMCMPPTHTPTCPPMAPRHTIACTHMLSLPCPHTSTCMV